MIKVFTSTLLESHLPENAALATEIFLAIINPKDLPSKQSDNHETQLLASIGGSADEAFNLASKTVALNMQTTGSSMTNSVEFDSRSDLAQSNLLNVVMNGYNKAMKERDEALASLAATSIINDNHIMQRYLGSTSGGSKPQAKTGSSEEDMMNLCKQLGSEIEARTTAENEINRLNERLVFEQKVAEARANELLAKIQRYEAQSTK